MLCYIKYMCSLRSLSVDFSLVTTKSILMLMVGLKLWKQGNIKMYFAVSSTGKHSYFKFSVQNALICGEWSWNTTVPDVWQHFLILAYQEPFFNPSILDWLKTNIDSFRNFKLHYCVSFHNNSNLGAINLHLKIFILSHPPSTLPLQQINMETTKAKFLLWLW